jgi:TolA-binding protein
MNFKFINHKDKNEKKQIWIYALILFAGAFIILLLTAYSQDKFQNNISEYQNKLSTEQKAKINVVSDFNAAVKENKQLKKEIDSLRNKIIDSEQEIATEEQKSTDLQLKLDNTIECNNLLLTAYEYYNNKDYINCAITLKYDINTIYLNSSSNLIYNDLAAKSYEKASKLLYIDGYKNYRNKSYDEAVVSLKRCIDFSTNNEYYADDAYYYLAKSYYAISKYDEAKSLISSFIDNYPKSAFVGDMKILYNKMM